VIDVANPSAPVFLNPRLPPRLPTTAQPTAPSNAARWWPSSTKPALSSGNNPSFVAFDLTNPAQPQLIQGTNVEKRFFSSPPQYVGNTAFVPRTPITTFWEAGTTRMAISCR